MNIFKKLFGSSDEPKKPIQKDKPSEPKTGSQTLSTKLNSIDKRRIRGQHQEEFWVSLWYASHNNELFVYGTRGQSESTKPIGIIPKKPNNTILPFLNKQNEYVYYKAYFNKSSELLTLELHRTTEKEVRMKKERNEKKAQESEEKLQTEYEKKLNRDYKLKKDLEEYVNLGTSDALKGKRKFGNLTLEFYEKSKYLNRRFNEAKLFENDKFLCKINLDIRIIRTFYSGHELTVKTCKIERERSYGATFTYLRPTIGVIDES